MVYATIYLGAGLQEQNVAGSMSFRGSVVIGDPGLVHSYESGPVQMKQVDLSFTKLPATLKAPSDLQCLLCKLQPVVQVDCPNYLGVLTSNSDLISPRSYSLGTACDGCLHPDLSFASLSQSPPLLLPSKI